MSSYSNKKCVFKAKKSFKYSWFIFLFWILWIGGMVGIIVYILSRVNWSTDKAVIEKWVIENKVFLEKIALIILIASAVVGVIFFILYVCISVNSCYLIGHKNSGGTKFWATLSLILGLGMVALWVYSIVQIWFTLDKTKTNNGNTSKIPYSYWMNGILYTINSNLHYWVY